MPGLWLRAWIVAGVVVIVICVDVFVTTVAIVLADIVVGPMMWLVYLRL